MRNSFGNLCDNGFTDNRNFNYTFAMIAQNSSSAPPGSGLFPGYAQMGFFRGWNQAAYMTNEYKQSHEYLTFNRNIHFDHQITDGSFNRYWVQVVPDPTYGYVIRMNVDTTVLDVTPFNPFVSGSFAPFYYGPMSPQIEGEVKYVGSDITGSSSVPTNISQMMFQHYDDQFYSLPPFVQITEPVAPRSGMSSIVSNAMNIWNN